MIVFDVMSCRWMSLLGRPGEYDMKILHDGFKNTYAFIEDNLKVVLGPT